MRIEYPHPDDGRGHQGRDHRRVVNRTEKRGTAQPLIERQCQGYSTDQHQHQIPRDEDQRIEHDVQEIRTLKQFSIIVDADIHRFRIEGIPVVEPQVERIAYGPDNKDAEEKEGG